MFIYLLIYPYKMENKYEGESRENRLKLETLLNTFLNEFKYRKDGGTNRPRQDRLKILLVDDNARNLFSAYQLREMGHDISIAQDFGEALGKLTDGEFEDYYSFKEMDTSRFDVVLSDLMFPLGDYGNPACRDTYMEAVLGYELAFTASRLGVPKFAILTDMNHHSSPLAATFDLRDAQETIIKINEMEVMIFDERDLEDLFAVNLKSNPQFIEGYYNAVNHYPVDDPSELYSGESSYSDGLDKAQKEGDAIRTKNWKMALELLLEKTGDLKKE